MEEYVKHLDNVVKSIKFKLDMMKENIEKEDFEY